MRQALEDLNELTTQQIDALRDLRAEAQSLKIVIDNAKAGAYDVGAHHEFIFKTYTDISRHCASLRESNQRDAEHPDKSDSISAILNRWEYLVIEIPGLLREYPRPDYVSAVHQDWIGSPSPDSSPDDSESGSQYRLRQLSEIDDALAFIIKTVGYLTIPERINRWLTRTESEDVISFHRIFEDELPDEGDRIRVLGLLASSPKRIPTGILDPVTGLIYRCPDRQFRLIAYIVIAAFSCLAALIAYIVMSYPDSSTWRPSLLRTGISREAELLLGGWIMLLAGMAAQRMVARRKHKDPTAAELRLTLTRWTRLAAAKATRIIEVLVLSVIALIVYHASLFEGLPDSSKLEKVWSLSSIFFLGYGFDSFLDLLSSEADRRSTSMFGGGKSKSK